MGNSQLFLKKSQYLARTTVARVSDVECIYKIWDFLNHYRYVVEMIQYISILISVNSICDTVVTNTGWACCADPFAVYANIKSLCRTTETNMISYVRFTSVKQ